MVETFEGIGGFKMNGNIMIFPGLYLLFAKCFGWWDTPHDTMICIILLILGLIYDIYEGKYGD